MYSDLILIFEGFLGIWLPLLVAKTGAVNYGMQDMLFNLNN
jgi:hypothetical protein